MTTKKITTRAFLELDSGGFVSYDKVAASPELQARLIPADRRHFEIAQARLRGEFKTAEDVVLSLDQWWAMMRLARQRGIAMPPYRVHA